MFEENLAGSHEALANTQGEDVVVMNHTLWAGEAKSIRETLDMTSEEFAGLLGVGPHEISAWEAGHSSPPGPATKLMELLRREPETVLRLLQPENL